jgi:hypothetical protein
MALKRVVVRDLHLLILFLEIFDLHFISGSFCSAGPAGLPHGSVSRVVRPAFRRRPRRAWRCWWWSLRFCDACAGIPDGVSRRKVMGAQGAVLPLPLLPPLRELPAFSVAYIFRSHRHALASR